MTTDADGILDRGSAATGRVRTVVAALADPAPALRHVIAAAERLVHREPSLQAFHADPFGADPLAAVVSGHAAAGDAARGSGARRRRVSPSRASSGPLGARLTASPVRAAAAPPSVGPPVPAVDDGPTVAPQVADPGDRRETVTPWSGPPREARPSGRATSTRDGVEGFASLATPRIDAVLARHTARRGRDPSSSAAGGEVTGAGAVASGPARPTRPSASAGRGGPSAAGDQVDRASSRAPAAGGHAVTDLAAGHPTGAGGHNGTRSADRVLGGSPAAESAERATGIASTGGEASSGFALRRGAGHPPAGPDGGAGTGARAASNSGPVHIPELTVAPQPDPAAGSGGFPDRTAVPPDPEDLAALVNEVLAEQARRHGVDLS